MVELLAIPAWKTQPTTLAQWVEELEKGGSRVEVIRESTGVSWVEVGSLRLRGYAVMEGGGVEAINFELAASDIGPGLALLQSAASALGWELYEDQLGDSTDDE
jgi:hypothetical protein